MSVKFFISVAALAACGLSSSVFAGANDIAFVETFKNRFFQQSGPGVVNGPIGFNYYHRIVGVNITPANVGTLTVTDPNSAAVSLTQYGGLSGPNDSVQFVGGSFSSEAALNTAVPPGDYVYSMSGGLFGAGTTTVTVPEDNYWSNVPEVLNWTAAQAINPTAAFNVSFAAPIWDPTSNANSVFWSIVTTGPNPQGITGGFLPANTLGSFTIDANLLAPNTEYQLSLDFSSRNYSGGQFGNSTPSIGYSFDTITNTTIRTIPTPGAAALLGLGGLMSVRRQRRSSSITHADTH